MKIDLKEYRDETDLYLEGNTEDEKKILRKWHQQMIGSLSKLNLKWEGTGGQEYGKSHGG